MKPKKIKVGGGDLDTVYEFSDGRFCVDVTVGGNRKRITRNSLEAAKLEGRKLIAQISSGRGGEVLLTRAEVEDYRLAKTKLASHKVSLLTVVDDWIAMKERENALVRKKVPALVEELLAEKELEGVSPLHLADRKSRLTNFAKAFPGAIDRITAEEIKLWLRDTKTSRRTQRNHRKAILQLFRFARAQGSLPRNEPTAVDGIDVGASGDGKIHIYCLRRCDCSWLMLQKDLSRSSPWEHSLLRLHEFSRKVAA